MTMFCLLVCFYYLPIFYQGTRLVSATRSGIDILPVMLSVVVRSLTTLWPRTSADFVSAQVAAGAAGGLISKFGRYWWFLVIGPAIAAVGAGLLTTIGQSLTLFLLGLARSLHSITLTSPRARR